MAIWFVLLLYNCYQLCEGCANLFGYFVSPWATWAMTSTPTGSTFSCTISPPTKCHADNPARTSSTQDQKGWGLESCRPGSLTKWRVQATGRARKIRARARSRWSFFFRNPPIRLDEVTHSLGRCCFGESGALARHVDEWMISLRESSSPSEDHKMLITSLLPRGIVSLMFFPVHLVTTYSYIAGNQWFQRQII